MALLLIPVVAFGYAVFLAFERGPHRSAPVTRARPTTVRSATLALNVLALTWFMYASARLRPLVPEGAAAGTVVYGGPGDGLFLLFMVALPWLSMQLINLPLAWAASTTFRQFFGFSGLLLACWFGASYIGWKLMECPPGIVCAGG